MRWQRTLAAGITVCILFASLLVIGPSSDATVTSAPNTLPGLFVDGEPVGVTAAQLDWQTLGDERGTFFVASSASGGVQVLQADGSGFGGFGYSQLSQPTNVAVGDDFIYVYDAGDGWVQYFDLNGLHWGGWNTGYTEGFGLTVYNNEVYVGDWDSGEVRVHSASGTYLRTIDGAGTAGELSSPNGLAVHNGVLYVVDSGEAHVVRFNPTTGAYLSKFGIAGSGTGQLTTPWDIGISDDGDVYVVDLAEKVLVYTATGTFQLEFPVSSPGGIWVDPGGRSLWVTDYLDRLIPHTYATCNNLVPTVVGTSFDDDMWKYFSSSADDIVFADAGDDTVNLGFGNDIACGFEGTDTIFGGDGNDEIFGGEQSDRLWGGDGDDLIKGQARSDKIYGEAGDDELYGGALDDLIYGGSGEDTIYGGIGNDRLFGQSGADDMYGEAGNDKVYGNQANDDLWGGSGDDRMWGGTGHDRLFGESGDDSWLDGDEHNDKVYGNSGADVIRGGDGRDKVYGQGGNDDVRAQAGDDWVTDGGPGIDSCQVAPEDTPGGDVAAINCE